MGSGCVIGSYGESRICGLLRFSCVGSREFCFFVGRWDRIVVNRIV